MPHLYLNRSLAKAEFGQHTETRADLKAALAFAQAAGDSDFTALTEDRIQEFEQE